MSTEYLRDRVDLDEGQHNDAKEMNDLINALVDKNSDIAKEALEAIMSLLPDMTGDDRFIHLYKVMTAVMDNQLQARYIEKSTVQPGVGSTSNE